MSYRGARGARGRRFAAMAAESSSPDAAAGPLAGERPGRLVLRSLRSFLRLARRHELRLAAGRLGDGYRLFDGRVYRVFRETVREPAAAERGASVIEVCFRLRFAGSSRVAHALFQRACILTTPFWSGFAGFATKLWMVEPQTGAYAGIYQWGEPATARAYLAVLLPVLRVVSVRGSVAYELHPDTRLAEFLVSREPQPARGWSASRTAP